MKFVLTLLCACSAFVAFSQDQVRYYDARHRLSDSTPRYLATITPSGGSYRIQEETPDGKLVMTGSYSALPNDLAKSRNGDFVYYYSNGGKKKEGAYRDNQRTGTWKYYAYEDGALLGEDQYVGDSLDGPSRNYHIDGKQLSSEGSYVNGKKEGLWKYFKSDGKMSREVRYVAGKKEGLTIDYLADGYNEKTTYQNDKELESHIFDSNGNEVVKKKEKKNILNDEKSVFRYVEQMPAPGYDCNEFLAKNIVYPDSARNHNIEGRVIVKFVVDEEGKINDVTLVKGVCPEIDEEAMRVVSMLPPWKPGKQNGRRVCVYFTMPIQFKLTN